MNDTFTITSRFVVEDTDVRNKVFKHCAEIEYFLKHKVLARTPEKKRTYILSNFLDYKHEMRMQKMYKKAVEQLTKSIDQMWLDKIMGK